MAELIPTRIGQFDSGMANDLSIGDPSYASIVAHFDNYTNPTKLTPHRSMKVAHNPESALDAFQITKIISANGTLFGLGIDVSGHPQVYTLVSPGDPTSNWVAGAGTSTPGSGAPNTDFFVLYQNYLYVGYASGGIFKYGDITSGGSQSISSESVSLIPSTQGLVHSKDDILYIPTATAIYTKNGSNAIALGIQLPVNSTVNSICEYNNYVAIACDQADGSTVVYLWDRDTSLTTLSEKIDWGYGSIRLIENIGGVLCGISTLGTLASLNPRVLFKYYSGSRVITFQQFFCALATISKDKQKFNDLFYFLAEITMHGTALKGVWKIYKKQNGQMTVSFDRLPRNDTALSAASLKGFVRWGDYVFVSYLNGGAYTIWRTDDQANYTATSYWETIVFNSVLGLRNKHIPDSSQKKDFVGASVTTEPLPSGGQVVLKYRVDATSSWSSAILTHSTLNEISSSITQIVARVPEHKEIYLRFESTGGAEITGVDMLEEVTNKKPY